MVAAAAQFLDQARPTTPIPPVTRMLIVFPCLFPGSLQLRRRISRLPHSGLRFPLPQCGRRTRSPSRSEGRSADRSSLPASLVGAAERASHIQVSGLQSAVCG